MQYPGQLSLHLNFIWLSLCIIFPMKPIGRWFPTSYHVSAFLFNFQFSVISDESCFCEAETTLLHSTLHICIRTCFCFTPCHRLLGCLGDHFVFKERGLTFESKEKMPQFVPLQSSDIKKVSCENHVPKKRRDVACFWDSAAVWAASVTCVFYTLLLKYANSNWELAMTMSESPAVDVCTNSLGRDYKRRGCHRLDFFSASQWCHVFPGAGNREIHLPRSCCRAAAQIAGAGTRQLVKKL